MVAALAACADALLYHAGEVIRTGEAVAALPPTDLSAVKRRVLQCGTLVKRSATEIAVDSSITEEDISAGGEGQQAAATARQPAPAARQGAGRGADADNDEDDDDDDFDDEDEDALPRPVIISGLLVFRALRRCLKAVLDGLAPSPTLDDVSDAARNLSDAVIDFAAGLNDGGAREAADALPLILASLRALAGLLAAQRGAAGGVHAALLEAVGECEASIGACRVALLELAVASM